MKRSWFRRFLDVSAKASRMPATLRLESLESREVPSGNPPTGSIPRQLIIEDAGPTDINLSSFFTDPENDPLSFAIVSQTNTTGFVSTSFDVNNNILTVTPAANAYGYSYFRLTVNDGSNTVNTTMELIVREKDDLTDDTTSVGSGSAVVLNVLGNDGTPDGLRIADAGNLKVVQNDTGNATTSVTVTFPQGTPDMLVATGSNRGDFNVQIGASAADDVTNGLYFSTVANNGRDNGEGTGAHIANANIDGTATPFIPVNRGGDGGEWNSNVGVAYFPYANGWMGGWIVNDLGTNGGSNNTIRSGQPNAGFDVGTSVLNVIRDLTAGQTRVTIPGINSQTDGILLALHGKNEDNFALCTPEAGGSWLLTVRDNGSNGTNPTAGNEQDPVAFVYIPRNMPNVVSGRILGNGTVELGSGNYNVTKTGTGTYELTIPGHSPLTGTLVLSPEGGASTNADNLVTYEPGTGKWVIQSSDITGSAATNIPLAEDVGAAVRMASFAFIPHLNTVTPRITSVQNTANTANVSDLGATVTLNPDGTVNYNPLTSATIQGLNPLQSIVDTFTYTTTSITGVTSKATVSVTVTAPSVWYVDDAWAGLNPGDTITDANPTAVGNQGATFGTDAFASLNAAVALAAPGRKILVNSGTYNESSVIDEQVEITFQEGNSSFTSISDTVSNASLILQPNVTLTLGDAGNQTISSPISGGGGLVKQGAGTLTLGGTNTFTGISSVTGGHLLAVAADAFGNAAPFNIAGGSELRMNGFNQSLGAVTGSGNITNNSATNVVLVINAATNAIHLGNIQQLSTGTVSLVKNGSGEQQLNGTNVLAAVTLNDGTLRVGSAAALGVNPAVTVNAGAILALNGFDYSFANLSGAGIGTVTNGAAANITLTTGDASDTTFAGGFTNGGSGTLRVVKSGTGTFNANGASAHSGGTVVSQGTLRTNNVAGFGASTLTLGDSNTGSNNVAALLSSNGLTITNPIIVTANGTGTATFGTAAGIIGAVNTQINSSLTINRDVILQAGSADRTTFAGHITGTGNILMTAPTAGSRITINRGATLPANNFKGDITIGDGAVLQLGVATLFANGNVPDASSITFVSATSELRLTTAATTPDVEGVNALISAVPGAGLITRPNGTGVLNFGIGAGNGSGTFSGVIGNTAGTLNIIKYGTGTQTFSGANTYTGTTAVNGGTMLADNTTGSAFSAGAVTVEPLGTLGGTGSFSGTLAVQGRLAPGTGGTGTLTTGPVTFSAGSVLAIDVSNNGTTFDLASIAEGSSLTGTTLKLYAGSGLTVGQQFLVLDNLGSAVLGNFANGTTISAVNNPQVSFNVNTAAGSGNDVQITVAAIAPAPVLDVQSGVATFNAAFGVNNAISLTNDGTNYTLDDSVGADITLTSAAVTAGWVANGNGSVTGPMGTTNGLVFNLGDGDNVLTSINAATNLTVSGSGTLTVSGLVTTTGSVSVNDFGSFAVQGVVTASSVTTTGVVFVTANAAGKLAAPTLNLTAAGIGTAANRVSTQATTIVAVSGGGGVHLQEVDGANVTVNVAAAGDVDIDNLSGALTIAGASSTVNGAFGISSAADLAVNAAITTGSGTVVLNSTGTLSTAAAITTLNAVISLTSQNAMTLGGDLNSGINTVAIAVNADGVGSESLNQTAGVITNTSTFSPAVSIIANQPGGGTGNIAIDSINVTGKLSVNSRNGSVLYAGATALTTSQQGIQNGGAAPARTLIAANYDFTATGPGSIGTDARPIQSSTPATNAILLSGGDGGVYWTDWVSAVVLNGATATGPGSVRVVAANADSHNLTVNGAVTTGSGSIYLAADDNFNLNAPIGGPGFSGTVYLAGNRDTGNTTNTLMNAGSSILTSNTSPNAVVLEGFNVSGTAAGSITFTQITTGDGGTITLNTNVLTGSRGLLAMGSSGSFLNAGPSGTVVLKGAPFTAAADAIGTAALPLAVTAGQVIVNIGNTAATLGNAYVSASGAASFTASNNVGTSFATKSGVLTVGGAVNSVLDGTITLTGAGGIAINAPLGGSTTGNIVMDAGTNSALVNSLLTINSGKTLTTTANGGTKVSTGGSFSGTGSTLNPVAVLSGGTITPADVGVGKLTTGNLSIAAGSTLRFDINGTATPGTDYDGIDTVGTVTLAGGTPQVFLGNNYVPAINDAFTVMTSSGLTSGSFATSTFLAANNSAVTFTATINANSVVFTVTNIVTGPVLDIIAGQLVYNGGGSAIDNNLTVGFSAGNYSFSEANEVITLGPGAVGFFTGSNGNKTFTGNAGTFTTTKLTLGAGNDTANITGINHPMTVDGGGQATDTVNIGGILTANGNFTVQNVNDITASAVGRIDATTISLTAANAIGTSGQSVLTKATTIAANAGVGGLFLSEADGAAVNATSTSSITVVNGSGTLDFTGNATGAGTMAVTSTTGTLNIAGVTNAAGNISLSSGDAVTLGANLSSTGGTIAINANTDGVGSEGYDQKGATVTTADVSAAALTITVNKAGGGSGDAVIGKGTVGSIAGGTITVNSFGGSILWSNDASYAAFTASQQGTSNGGSNAQVLFAHDYALTSTGAGSIGTSLRPLQTNIFAATDEITGQNTASFNAGTGGIYVLDWGAQDMTITNAVAAGGDIRLVAANVAGSNFFISGTVFTGAGNIAIYTDDELTLDPTAVIGGAAFGGTVELIANRDLGNNQTVNMLAGSKVITTNTGSAAVTIASSSANGGVGINLDMPVGGVMLADVTAGTGGTITVNGALGTATGRQGSVVQRAGTVLTAPGGTVNLLAFANTAATAQTNNAGNIGVGGDASAPVVQSITVNAANVIVTTNGINTLGNTGNVNVIGTGATAFNVVTTGATASTVTLLTQAGALTVAAPLATAGGAVSLSGFAGVVLNAALGSATTGTIGVTGDLSGAGNILTGTGTLTLTQPGNSTYTGSISGSQALVKEGAGALTIAGGSFSGTTSVNAGTLLVNGSIASSVSATVVAGAVIGGTGSIPTATVAGKITGGSEGGAGQLTAASLITTGTLHADLLGTVVGTQYDQIVVPTTGSVDITGATLALNAPNALPGASKFTIIDNQSGNPIVGKFANLPNEGDAITVGGNTFNISYVGGIGGNDVVLTRQGSASPVVTGIVVNGNPSPATQRSRLTQVVVSFASPVDVNQFHAAGAVFFTRTGVPTNNVETVGTVVNNTNGLIITPANGSGSTSSITLTFQNIDNAGIDNASLADGRWTLDVVPAGYTANSSNTGNQLRRLFGDIDNNGTVDGVDFSAFPPFAAVVGSPFDFDNNSNLDANDFAAFGGRNGYSLA